MSKPLQLHIPTPCHENWANMQPSEKGRHCAACQKTVVDFTAMSDPEIIRYLSKAGSNVCGRLAPDQVNRPLIPLTPPQQNRLPGWPLLLTGILLTHNESNPYQQGKPVTYEQPAVLKTDDFGEKIGEVAAGNDSIPKDTIIDTSYVTVGALAFEVPDSTVRTDRDSVLLGDMVITQIPATREIKPNRDTNDLPLEHILTGAVQCKRPRTVDTLKQFIIDTLSALRLAPQKQTSTPQLSNVELTVYPNPAPRGVPFHLAWQTDPGKYQVSLFSSSGALIQERMLDISSTKQITDWQLPTNAPAGIYIIRAIRPGQTGVYARELVVQ